MNFHSTSFRCDINAHKYEAPTPPNSFSRLPTISEETQEQLIICCEIARLERKLLKAKDLDDRVARVAYEWCLKALKETERPMS